MSLTSCNRWCRGRNLGWLAPGRFEAAWPKQLTNRGAGQDYWGPVSRIYCLNNTADCRRRNNPLLFFLFYFFQQNPLAVLSPAPSPNWNQPHIHAPWMSHRLFD